MSPISRVDSGNMEIMLSVGLSSSNIHQLLQHGIKEVPRECDICDW